MGIDDEWGDDAPEDALVVDTGSAYIKAGMGAESEGEVPGCVMESCIARPFLGNGIKDKISEMGEDHFIGSEAQEKRGICTLHWPIQDGVVNDWDAMEKLWAHAIDKELQIVMEDAAGVMMTEAPLSAAKTRSRAMATWMEIMGAANYFVALGPQLALMQSGKDTGLCIDSGDGVTTIMPMVNSTILSHAMFRIPLGGRQCTRLMERLLMDGCSSGAGCFMSTSAERMSVMEMKKECYVSMSFEDELEKLREAEPKKFSLPDSSQVDLTDQLIQVPELMFQPSLYGHETMGLHQLVQHCVEACSLDVRAQLLQNVLLCGGNSMFPNMAKRLQAEIRGLVDPEWEESLPMFKKAKCNFSRKANDKEDEQHKLSHQQFAAWTGGCILSSLEYFKNEYWISKASYDEKGPDYAYEQLRWFTV